MAPVFVVITRDVQLVRRKAILTLFYCEDSESEWEQHIFVYDK